MSTMSLIGSQEVIVEDSRARLAAALVPFVGVFSNIYNESSLAQRIRFTVDQVHLATLIEIKNRYKLASITRNIIQILVSSTLFAQEDPILTIAAACICGTSLGFAVWNSYYLYHNKKVIQVLNTIGYNTNLYIL